MYIIMEFWGGDPSAPPSPSVCNPGLFPPAQRAKLKIICVKKEQKSAYLDTFAIQTSYIAYMVCSYSQGGGSQLPPAPQMKP